MGEERAHGDGKEGPLHRQVGLYQRDQDGGPEHEMISFLQLWEIPTSIFLEQGLLVLVFELYRVKAGVIRLEFASSKSVILIR